MTMRYRAAITIVNSLVSLVGAFALMGNDLVNDWKLCSSGVSTTGTVVDLASHQHVTYRFFVGKQSFSSTDVFPGSSPMVAERVRVFYSTSDPSISILRPPRIQLQNDFLTLVGIALLLFIATGVAVVRAVPWFKSHRFRP